MHILSVSADYMYHMLYEDLDLEFERLNWMLIVLVKVQPSKGKLIAPIVQHSNFERQDLVGTFE